MHVSVEM